MERSLMLKGWVLIWIVVVMCTTIFNPFKLLPIGVMSGCVLFLFWFGFYQVLPKVDWDSKFDIAMAYNVILFFGTMMAFIIPCLYDLDQQTKWNNWCQTMTMLWIISILVGLGGTLYKEYKIMGFWKYIVAALWLLFMFIFIMSCLGFFFNIYLV